jgi:hypothetical protein
MVKKTSERKEAWMRILVAIVTGIILCAWGALIKIFVLFNWLYAVFAGKRSKGMARLSEIWNTQFYDFLRYITFVTNKRPFPFSSLKPSISRFG